MSKSKKDSNKEKDKEKELTALFHKCYITIKDNIKCKSNIWKIKDKQKIQIKNEIAIIINKKTKIKNKIIDFNFKICSLSFIRLELIINKRFCLYFFMKN